MYNNVMFVLLASLLISLFTPTLAFAKSYTIPSLDITATLQPDGSMLVREERNYSFDGDYTFAYQYINRVTSYEGRSEPYNLSHIEICELDDCYRELTPSEITGADDSRPEGTYYALEKNDQYYLKWFYRASSENRTFILSYKVDNAMTLQQD